MPVSGQVGLLISGLLVRYINLQGLRLVAAVLAAAGLYFASAVSFSAIVETLQIRWLQGAYWLDRWRDWREQRAELKEERLAERALERAEQNRQEEDEADREASLGDNRGWLARLFHRRRSRGARPGRHPRLSPLHPALRRGATRASPQRWHQAQHLGALRCRTRAGRAYLRARRNPRNPPHLYRLLRARAARPPPDLPPRAPRVHFRPTSAYTPAPIPEPHFEPFTAPAPAAQIAINERADADLRTAPIAPKHVSGFKLPPSTLLNPAEGPQTIREDELREEARVLVEKCAEFDVRGQVVQINPGPMVTTYEFKPEAGVKYSRVTGLGDDLCLAMRAESILIERMAGKSTVGIQVPNHDRETISLRDCIESESSHKAKPRLTIAMGKDINGLIRTADLATMPHVLIAGSTGSGKSVAINAMIMSLLYRTTPAQVRLILVDPKRVELGMYEGVPHLFTPIITEAKLAANALRNAVREMERRLKLLASRSVRNIDQYNKLFEGSTLSLFGQESRG